MATRRPNHRLLKHRRTYTVEELAHRLSVHENTVRAWYTDGLESIDDGRPMLFRGDAVSAFLQKRRAGKKQPCGVGRLYCLPCRTPREPAGGMLDYVPSSLTAGSLSGLCPACHCMMFRRVARERVAEVAGGLEVQFPRAEPRLRDCAGPIVNCDSSLESQTT